MTFVNQHSYLIAAVIVLALVGWWAYRRRTLAAVAIFALSAVILVGANLALRTGDPTVAAAAEFDRALADGRPTLVEFYSNY